MAYGFLDVAATPNVRAVQAAMGSDHLWRDYEGSREFDRFGPNEAGFIARRDSFYMATVSETGWPYVQHRGGPPGFLKVLDDRTLAFADFRGNPPVPERRQPRRRRPRGADPGGLRRPGAAQDPCPR